MPSSPALSSAQALDCPVSRVAIEVSPKSQELVTIQAEQWQPLSSNQRQVQFKAHYESVQNSLKTIATFLEKSVDQAAREYHADPQNKALKKVQAHRNKALHHVKTYRFEKAAPKMLDLLYLNQTRQHLEQISQQLGNDSIDPEVRLGAALELTTGLNVCKEGVALNILACAKNLNSKTQGHPLRSMYQAARDELINQHLLTAVRMSHAHPVFSPTQTTQLTGYQESNSATHQMLEIHEVQALRNALSKDLGLEYLSDRHISPNYEKVMGSIAKTHIPQLVTTHAVASRVADDLLNHVQNTGLLTEEVLSVNEKSDLHQVVDISGSQYKDLVTTLQNELGIDPILLFDVPDEDFNKLALVSHSTLTSRLVEWIASERDKPGSPMEGLGETCHQPVSRAEINEAMKHFLDTSMQAGDKQMALDIYRSDSNRHLLMSNLQPENPDNKKKKEREQEEIRKFLFNTTTPIK
jgi:hypothetical protein